MKTDQEAVVALREWMFDMHRMGRDFSLEERKAAESAALHAAMDGAEFQSAFHAGVIAINAI
jgi:hypothetical protein